MANQPSLATRWSGRCRTAGISAAICLLTGGLAIAQPDTWTTLRYPTPAPGVDRTFCIDLNDRGEMVGWRVAPNKAFLLQDGQYYDLHPAAAASSLAYGINAHGDIVGDYTVAGVTIGALWSKGTLLPIEFSGNIMTHLRGINARGDIVGFTMETYTSPYRGFLLRSDGQVFDVQYPGATGTGVFGVNDKGDMVGEYRGSDGTTRGFLRTKNGDFLSLEYPGAVFTSAQRINGRGEVVGYYWDAQTPSVSHGFKWMDGEFEQANYPGATHTMLHGINNQGDTCGMHSFTIGRPIVWGGFAHTGAQR